MKQFIYVLIIPIFLTGCLSSYPMGVDEDTWKLLSAEKKAELFKEEAKQREFYKKLKHEEELKKLDIEAMKEQRLKELLQISKYGDIIRVNIFSGCINLYKKCKPYRPISILLQKNETRKIQLKMSYSSLDLWIRYDNQGILIDDDKNLDDFDTAVFLPERWDLGRYYRFNLKSSYSKRNVLQNAKIYIQYIKLKQ
ncbi:hypothetical protein ACKGJI_06465 [Sulfurospirillum sp. 1307]|jgi:hypothetical protein